MSEKFEPMGSNSFAFTVSREQALMWGMDDFTPEELAAHNAKMSAFHAEQRALRALMLSAYADMRNMSSLGNAILDLHSCDLDAEWGAECPGCDFDGYEGEAPSWPCRTVVAVAQHYGVVMPDRSLPGKHYEGEYRPRDGKRVENPLRRWRSAFYEALDEALDTTVFHGAKRDA